MRTLTATLLTAQKAPIREGVLICRVADQPVEWPRWTWTSIYSSADPDGPHAIVKMSSGALVRARQTATGALYVQKITDPTNAAQWATWTLLEAAGVTLAAAGIALASSDLTDALRLFRVDAADSRSIRCWVSTDGVAWASELVITEPVGSSVKALAADLTSADNHLIYIWDNGGAAPSEQLVAITRTAPAVWGVRTLHAQTRYPNHGLCAARDATNSSIYTLIADAEGDGSRRLSAQEYNAATDTWGGGTIIIEAPAGSNYDYLRPDLRLPGAFPRNTLTYVEKYTGAVPFTRPTIAITPQRYNPTETVPWGPSSAYGFKLLRTPTAWHLVGATRAWTSPLESGGPGQLVDVSASVATIDVHEPGPNRAARLTVLLDNADGAYSAIGTGPKIALREGSQLALGLGYRTANGNESVWTVPWWIDRLAFLDDNGQALVKLECIDAWAYLERLRATRQAVFPPGSTIATALNLIIWHVCGTTLAATGRLAPPVPGFTIQPGESYAQAARRLCRLAGVTLRFATLPAAPDGLGPTSVVASTVPYATGASVYSYAHRDQTIGQHPVQRAEYAIGGQPISHVETFGTGYTGEAIDQASIDFRWKDVVEKLVEKAADTQAKADNLAAYELTAAQAAGYAGWLEATANVGLELADIIDITDVHGGLTATKRTVTAIRTIYDRRKSRFDQRLDLKGAS